MHPLLFQLGPIAVPSYGVFAAFGVLAALFVSARLARAMGVDANRIWNLCVLMIFTALIGSRILLVMLNWSDFRRFPLWMVGLASMRAPWMLVGGGALALLVGLAYALMMNLPLLRTLDVLTPGLALGYAISCIGSFWAGSSYGSPTTLPWGVAYRSRLAALWSGTPLGVRLHPTQLYEALLELLFFCALMLLWRKLRPGELLGMWLFLLGLSSFFLAFVRGNPHPEIVNGGLLPGQAVAVLLVIAGGVFWWKHDRVEARV